ncbi:MAG: hypothetical protein L0219_00775 [Phycisphaerales bacterium]|nr:hypothetical protein [Phycisphaerales bacterium]
MSERVDQFCSSLQQKLNDVEEHMNSLKANLEAVPQKAAGDLHRLRNRAKQNLESQRQAIDKAKASVRDWATQQKAEAQTTIDEWKTNHQAKKLAHRADRAQEYAAAAVQLAAWDLDEAEQAVFEAIVARMDADAVPV